MHRAHLPWLAAPLAWGCGSSTELGFGSAGNSQGLHFLWGFCIFGVLLEVSIPFVHFSDWPRRSEPSWLGKATQGAGDREVRNE